MAAAIKVVGQLAWQAGAAEVFGRAEVAAGRTQGCSEAGEAAVLGN